MTLHDLIGKTITKIHLEAETQTVDFLCEGEGVSYRLIVADVEENQFTITDASDIPPLDPPPPPDDL